MGSLVTFLIISIVIGVLYPLFLLLGFSIRNAFILDMVLAAIVAIITIYPEVLKKIKPIMESGWGRIGVASVIVGLAILVCILVSSSQDPFTGKRIVTKKQALMPEEPKIEITNPEQKEEKPRQSKREIRQRTERTIPRKDTTQPRVSSNRIRSSPRETSSDDPGSGLNTSNVETRGGTGGYGGKPRDTAGDPGSGAGFRDEFDDLFSKSREKPRNVIITKERVVITRLKHFLSNCHIYDESLGLLEKELNANNPDMLFSIVLQQKFSLPDDGILLIMGEDPQEAFKGGRIDNITRDFTPEEKKKLEEYTGVVLVMEATPGGGTGSGFTQKVKEELKDMELEMVFVDDFVREFNESETYNYLANILNDLFGDK